MYLWSSFIKFVFHNISITHIPDYAITGVKHDTHEMWVVDYLYLGGFSFYFFDQRSN